MFISVIIPTFNPDKQRLQKTLQGLKDQSYPLKNWELILVDNNSSLPVEPDLSWHSNHTVIHTVKQGLTFARLAGFHAAKGEIIVMVDDDNILEPAYLMNAVSIFQCNPELGAVGGRSLPLFEGDAPYWLSEFNHALALRDLGDKVITARWEGRYPGCAPIGAGMCLRKNAVKAYLDRAEGNIRLIPDRTGNDLSSSGDNDLIVAIMKTGWQVGYSPTLCLEHIIPVKRTQVDYLSRLLYSTNKSWVQLLDAHEINPWQKMTPFAAFIRKFRSWFVYKAWNKPVQYIKWRGACGHFDGLSCYK